MRVHPTPNAKLRLSFRWLGGILDPTAVIKLFHKPVWSAEWMGILILPGQGEKEQKI